LRFCEAERRRFSHRNSKENCMDQDTQETAAQRAEKAWNDSPELRAYYGNDKLAWLNQNAKNSQFFPTNPDQPEVRA